MGPAARATARAPEDGRTDLAAFLGRGQERRPGVSGEAFHQFMRGQRADSEVWSGEFLHQRGGVEAGEVGELRSDWRTVRAR